MEIICIIAGGGLGVLVGRSLHLRRRPAPSGSRRLEEATIACNPLQVIGGARRGPGAGGGA
ncbi:MAG TPA: hypothetical protein VGV69_05955 [Solirubrobacterales bacterium]|nr:hypothetical protein [Solirubrobacterales bacterium]